MHIQLNDPDLQVKIVQGTGAIRNYDLRLRPGDTDWYHPLKLMLEESAQRPAKAKAKRNADRAQRRHR